MRCKVAGGVLRQQSQRAARHEGRATPGPGGSQQISRLEASGGVIVTQKDQTATGDTGLFDMKANTVTLLGNVVVSQGQNVMRGERLVVDLTTGVSRVDAGESKGPVRMLIEQNKDGSLRRQGDAQSPLVAVDASGIGRRRLKRQPRATITAQRFGAGEQTCSTISSRCSARRRAPARTRKPGASAADWR